MDDFLRFLWPQHGVGELRVIHSETTVDNVAYPEVDQMFYDLAHDGVDSAVQHARYFDSLGRDVYFGVLPRLRLSGKAADAWPNADVLWADIDAKHFEDSKDAALHGLLAFELPASVIVDSGHGYHAYWKLLESVPFADARLAMQGIQIAVNGDSVHDAARVLRIPGTHNHKLTLVEGPDGELTQLPPEPVRLLRFDTTRKHRFADFNDAIETALPRATTPLDWTVRPTTNSRRRLDELPDWLMDLIGQGAPKGTRSEQTFKACVWLLRYGYAPEEIYVVFSNSPIGAKMIEKGEQNGRRWFDRTIAKAQIAAVQS